MCHGVAIDSNIKFPPPFFLPDTSPLSLISHDGQSIRSPFFFVLLHKILFLFIMSKKNKH